jgi:uncharacterized membrane protein YfcA
MEFSQYLIAIAGGFIAGAINTLAGNGSAITLTILTEILQLPPNIANGTNRIGVFFQTSLGAFEFYRHGKLQLRRSGLYILITIIGSVGGVATAIMVTHAQFKAVFSYLLVFMLITILVKPGRWLKPSEQSFRLPLWASIPLFLALGFYGGFIQMGMGIFFLAAMVLLARYSIIEGNAVKLFVVGAYTFIVILIFQWRGLIDWQAGLIMAIGQSAGGWLTANLAARLPGASVWAYRLLVVIVVLAILLAFDLLSLTPH